MQNPAKAIVLALLVAIPSPFILGFLLVTFTPELFQILSQAGTSEEATSTTFVLGSAQGIAAYIIAVVLFGLAGFVTVALAAKKPSAVKQQAPRASTAPRQPAPRKQQSQPDYEDDDDYDDSTLKAMRKAPSSGSTSRKASGLSFAIAAMKSLYTSAPFVAVAAGYCARANWSGSALSKRTRAFRRTTCPS